MKPKVYLAGPISGLTYDEAEAWRFAAGQCLAPEIECFSPLRHKEFLHGRGVLEGSYTENPLATDRGIMTRDHWDVRTSDLVLCNLLGTSRVSIGTVMETAWCHVYRKPLVMVIEPDSNIHDHPMVREAIDYRVATLSAAAAVIRAVLLAT